MFYEFSNIEDAEILKGRLYRFFASNSLWHFYRFCIGITTIIMAAKFEQECLNPFFSLKLLELFMGSILLATGIIMCLYSLMLALYTSSENNIFRMLQDTIVLAFISMDNLIWVADILLSIGCIILLFFDCIGSPSWQFTIFLVTPFMVSLFKAILEMFEKYLIICCSKRS